MNILIIYAHPNEKSFCSAIKKKFVEGLKENKNTVRIHDLYSSNLNIYLLFQSNKHGTKVEMVSCEADRAIRISF